MKSTFTNSTKLFTIFSLLILFLPPVILAQIGPGIVPINTPSGGFKIDGTLLANTAAGDWVDGTGTGGFVLNNSGGALNPGTTYHLYDLYNTSLDNIFGGGDKVGDNPNNWTWTPGTANDKTDMNNALIHLTTDSNGNVWVVFAADRLSNNGNAYVDFEFLQTAMSKTANGFTTLAPASTGGRTLGDFLLTVYFESGVAKFDIQRWELVGGIWEYKTYFSSLPLNSVLAAGNTSNVPVPYQAFGVNTYLQNTFIESAVNLTEVLGAIDPCTSLKIKTVFVKSKTSTSSTAAIKDFFNPVAIDNLTLGSSDAGDDATICSGMQYSLQGSAVPSNGYQVISKTWSLVSGTATIDNPNSLNSNVNITGNSATFRLTVVTGPGSGSGSQCTVTDDVTITVNQPTTCDIIGLNGSICPSSTSNIYSAPTSASYEWSISGNGTIVGSTNSQSVSVTAGASCNATFILSLKITDANGCISTCTKTITVIDNTAPTWSTLATALDTKVECSDDQALATAQAAFPIAADLCDTDVANITKVSGAFVPSLGCANAGTYTNTWTVKDDCGNTSAVFTQVITIEDTTAPTWSTLATALDTKVECSDDQALATAQAAFPIAADLCDTDVANITKVSGAFVPSLGCANAGTYTNTWTVKDDCGNTSAVFTQVITIEDTTAPTGTAPADITGLHSVLEVPIGDVSVIIDEADNCNGTVDITIVDTNNGASGCIGDSYIIVRTYILSDCAGNKTSLIQKITVENNVSVSGIPTNVTCQGEKDGSITITNSIGSTVVITNNANEVVGSNGLPAGTYTLTATSIVGNDGQTCTAISSVTITEPDYRVKLSGVVSNRDTNLPLANVPVTLIPQGSTPGGILIKVTNLEGYYAFIGVTPGDYLLQVQDANLNNNQQLYSIDSNSFFTTIEECKYQIHNFEYEKSDLPVIGDFVWYDVNNNGLQDEWYDANNDGNVTKNIPDANGAIDYSLWEWIDFNGDNSYKGAENIGELNAAGLGNLKSSNILITGPNGYSKNAMLGIQGYYIDRPTLENPWGEYKIQLIMDSYLDIVSQAMGATGLVKELPSNNNKLITSKTNKSESFTVCGPTSPNPKVIQITPDDRVNLDVDFGISCRLFANVDAKDDIFNAVQCTFNGKIGNVIDNDLLNELKINNNEVVFKIINASNPKITFDELGNISIQAGIKAGKYSFEYQICEKINPTNCDNAFVTVNIIDTTNPIWTTTVMPQDLTVQCVVPQPATMTSTDSCGEVILKYNETRVDGNCVSNYILTRVWTATDESGNMIAHTQKITVNDTTAPTTTTVFTPSINVNCDAIPAKPELVFVDNCSTVSSAIFTENIINRTENSYSIVRKWTVSDACGNTADFTQIINVTIPNSVTTISSSICNDGETTTANLNDLLPAGTPTSGTWVDVNNSGRLQGNILDALGLSVGNYIFEYKVNDANCPRTITIIMTVNTGCGGIVLACGTVVVHNAFSPNGDGINEKFIIDNIDDTVCYPENTVEIYNRWGVLVFETKGYNNTSNSFDGISGGRSTVKESSGLPTGVYFYILNYTSVDNNGKIISNRKDGYLYLTK